jgi:hypothetical protein
MAKIVSGFIGLVGVQCSIFPGHVETKVYAENCEPEKENENSV